MPRSVQIMRNFWRVSPDCPGHRNSTMTDGRDEYTAGCSCSGSRYAFGGKPGAAAEMLEIMFFFLFFIFFFSNDWKSLKPLPIPSMVWINAMPSRQAGRFRILVEKKKYRTMMRSCFAGISLKKLKKDLTYPGQIKVTVIRETRVSDYAR